MTTHELKTWPEPFEAVWQGRKAYELRKDDRDFAVGDLLHLREWDPATEEYSGREYVQPIRYLTRGPEWGVPEGMVVLSIPRGANEVTSEELHSRAALAAETVARDISGRSGLGDEWDQVSDDVLLDIIEEWTRLIECALAEPTE